MNERLALLEQRVEYPEVVVVGGGYAGAPLLPHPARQAGSQWLPLLLLRGLPGLAR